MNQYEIKRDTAGHRKVKPWMVLKNGDPYESAKGYPMHFRNRREAQEEIDKDIAHDAYLAQLYEQDAAAVRAWTAEQEREIDEYAEVLRVNAESWTFWGKYPAREIARRQHERDARDLASNSWIDPRRIHAEKRRAMAARVEAFRRAGLEL